MGDEEMLQDFLLDMDFDELIPVDNFFDSYVGALSKDGPTSRPMEVPAPPVAPPGNLDRVYADSIGAGAQQPPPNVQIPASFGGAWPGSTPGAVNGGLPMVAPLDVMGDTATNMGAPQLADGKGYHSMPAGMDANMGAGVPELTMPHAVPETSDSLEHRSPAHHRNNTTSRRNQTKTERQQMLNKAAQQRYRERKKAKANELKNAVSCLQDKVQELSMVHAEKNELQDRVTALEKELAIKEAKLASMHQQKEAVSGVEVTGALAEESLQSDASDFSNQFAHEVTKMRQWLTANGYMAADGCNLRTLAAEDVSAAHLETMRELGHQCYSSCLRCLSMFTDVDVGALVGSSSCSAAAHFQGDPSQWHDLVTKLCLEGKVKEHALQLRERYMAKLEALFHERQLLNLEAVKVLLPQEVGGMSGGKQWQETPNFFHRYRHAYDTANVLRRLRSNLAEEQKALAELDYLVYVKLLDPVQLARCILTAFPQHCDVVSLLNAVHACCNA